jgi:uncharacterized protein
MEIVMPARPRPEVDGVTVDRDVFITVRDGVRIAVDIYRPTELQDGKYPTLYAMSAYQKDLVGMPALPIFPWRECGPIEWYVKRGYVYVLADARGTGKSEGIWRLHDRAEQEDMYDTIEWIAAQAWSNGRVGMIGQSYYGLNQWLAAVQNPPHLTCIAPYDAFVDPYRDEYFHGGILSSGMLTNWTFRTRGNQALGPGGRKSLEKLQIDPTLVMLEHPINDEFWQERASFWQLDQIQIPVFSIGNWGKNALHLRGNILGYETVNSPKKLLIEAGARPESLSIAKALMDFESVEFHEEVLAPWYDYWLKGEETGVMDEPPVKLFVHGRDEWYSSDSWPLKDVEYVPYYLRKGPAGAVHSLNDGVLSTTAPAVDEGSTSYSYPDPQWHNGPVMINSRGLPNSIARVLTFSTEPLLEDIEVIGPIVMVLYASSDQIDTDFIVKVSDQHTTNGPDVPADIAPPFNTVTRGWLKASHRQLDPQRSTPYRPFHSHVEPEPLEPGKVYRFDIEVWPIAQVFKKGHRIRIEIANADSSMTEGTFTHFYGLKYGTDTIFHDEAYPSHILFPVMRR